MSTWRPPWSAQGQFKLTLLPATRASNSVTARPPPGPGSTAALRAGSAGPLHPATCPPIWGAGEVGASPTPSRPSHEYRHPGPRDSPAGGRRRPERTPPQGRSRLATNSFQRFRTAHSLRQPRTAEGLPDIGSPQARGAVDTRDCGSAARTPRQRTRSTASRGPSGLQRAIPRCRLGLGARGARPASARTHEPGRIVAHESIGADCPRGGRRLWPG
jgi:hypothetical protein